MTDKPVMETDHKGSKFWFLNDELHNEHGPAYEKLNGYKEWWLHGKKVTEEEVIGDLKWTEGGVHYAQTRPDNLLRTGPLGSEDNVNSPNHYNQGGIECIEAIKASLGDDYKHYCKGNVMKYLWRYEHKNGLEDLKKAQWYLNSMVESLEEDNG